MRNRTLKPASELEADPVEHYTRLAEEFGHARRGRYRARDDGRPISNRRLLLEPLSLFIMSMLALVLLCGIQLWRMGMFDAILGPRSAVVDRSSKRWLLNGRAAPVADDRVADTEESEELPSTEDEPEE